MHKILKNLSGSGDITELLKFLDTNHPEVLEESIKSKEKSNSFFLHFAYGIQENYEKINYLYQLNKKYGYKFINDFNQKNETKDELKEIINSRYSEQFIIDCLNELPKEERIQLLMEKRVLSKAFDNNRVKLLEELQKYTELWKDEKELKYIKDNYLKNLALSELFYKNTNTDNNEEMKIQCVKFIEHELKLMEKYNLESTLDKIVTYLKDMSKKEEVFTQEFKEQLVGLSLESPYTKVTNAVLKTLFNEKLSTYKPEKPLWMHFEHLKNKDILYQFLDNIKYNDYWEDKEGVKHYKIDYLEKALTSMDVKIDTKGYGKDNRAKRNRAISITVLPTIEEYLVNEIEGKIGFVREVLKPSSIIVGQFSIKVPEKTEDMRSFIDKTLGFKEQDELIVLKKIKFYMRNIKGVEEVLANDLFKDEELKIMLENFSSYQFDEKRLEMLKEKMVEKSLILNLEEIDQKKVWGKDKIYLEEITTINNYNKMQKKFENTPENKVKKAKI